jgi:hypothetical protein
MGGSVDTITAARVRLRLACGGRRAFTHEEHHGRIGVEDQ